jgi:hypothetical protein
LIWYALVGRFRSRASLEAENLALRQQLNIPRRKSSKKLALSNTDRLVFAGLYRFDRICGDRFGGRRGRAPEPSHFREFCANLPQINFESAKPWPGAAIVWVPDSQNDGIWNVRAIQSRTTLSRKGRDQVRSRLGQESRRSLVFSLVVECLHSFREKRSPAVPYVDVQQMIRLLGDEVRICGAGAPTCALREIDCNGSTRQ